MEKQRVIDIFSELGRRLAGFGSDGRSCGVVEEAVAANGWFTAESVCMAVGAIRETMLDPALLAAWLDGYRLPAAHGRTLGIIMAGNIPLVGFADLLYGVACGYECHVKTSGKDRVLMMYVIGLLKNIDYNLKLIDGLFSSPGLLIATGSDNTVRQLRDRYPDTPSLLRGSRSSVGVLTGRENEVSLQLLAKDIFSYSGLGCRNVSLLFVPRGYDMEKLVAILSAYPGIHGKYRNNYLQSKALLRMNGCDYIDGGFFTVRPGQDCPVRISEIVYRVYDSPAEVDEWIAANDRRLQCVVSEGAAVPFGRSQYPGPADYPDRCDVMEFLGAARFV